MSTARFTGHEPGTPSYRRLLTALFCAGVATFAQLYAPQAVLPLIAADRGLPPATAALAVSAATLGLALAVIPWSLIADRIGRIPAMAIGIIAATTCGLLTPFAPNLTVMLLLRAGEGIALGALPAVALAYLSEEVHRRYVAAAAGSYIAGTTVGGLTGRLIAGPVGEAWSWQAGIGVTAVVCAIAATVFLVLIPRSQGFTPGRMREEAGPGILTRLARPLRSLRQQVVFAQGFLLMGAFVAVYNYLGFHLSAPPFLLPTWLVTLLFVAYIAGTLSSPIAGALSARHGRYRVLLLSIVAMAGGAALLLVPQPLVIVAGLIVFTAGFFAAHAVASGWAPVLADAETRAQASSLYYFGYYAGSSLCGWALGFVLAQLGWEAFVVAVLVMCGVAVALAASVLRGAESR